ncbi:MAG: radical SAM protein [Candidatus Aminicenantes bacterium]|nr:radical SAM protein [Candidatus Aminicenantes bacterium]
MYETHSHPFRILQEGDFWILVHKNRPVWMVTNELGKDIASRNPLKSSNREIAEFLRNKYGPSDNLEKDIQGFKKEIMKAGLLEEGLYEESQDPNPVLEGILFLVTQTCNLACHHCSWGNASVPENFPKDFFQKIVEELGSLGVRSLLISGGEPILWPDLFDMISFASPRLRVSLSTNGTLIGDTEAQKLKEAGVSEIAISMDGLSARTHDDLRGKGSFQQTLQGIDSLKRAGLGERINLQFCLSKRSIDEAMDLPKFAENLGVRKITYLSMKKLGRASQDWDDLKPDRESYQEFLLTLYETLFTQGFPIIVNSPLSGFRPVVKPQERVSTCPFGTQLIVDVKGGIYPCPGMLFPEYRLGNVFDMNIEEALCSPKFEALKEEFRARQERIDRCRSCAWRNLCRGGCTSSVYTEKGTIWETDDLCDLRDKLYRRAIISAAQKKLSRREEVHASAS